jgi:hypothetical protein
MGVLFQRDWLSVSAVFSGSFLLFLIQPLLGRTLLPVFGGSASVWCVCLAAYQTLLLAGYLYAHGIAGRRVANGRGFHTAVVAFAALWAWAVAAGRGPLLACLAAGPAHAGMVLAGVALFAAVPYVTLAAGSTLVQAWRAETGDRPEGVYSLYAVSNVGALMGLLSYPFAFEPFVSLTVQWVTLASGLTVYAALIMRLAVSRTGAAGVGGAERRRALSQQAPARMRAIWFALPAASAFLLNAVTAHLLVDVTPMPLVWVVPLVAFLASYAVGFSPLGARRPGAWCAAAALALAAAAWARGQWGTGSLLPNAVAGTAVLFVAGTVLHGWLYAERPAATELTRYYLAVAAGGAAGGLLASLVAPLVFSGVSEYPLALLACAVLVAWRCPKPASVSRSPTGSRLWVVCSGLAWLALSWTLARHTQSLTLFAGRNFYGCLRVTRTLESFGRDGTYPVHYLWCGQTTHGIQVQSPQLRKKGTSYYGPAGGGVAFLAHPAYRAGQGVKVGVVGLGAGCLACYGREGDLFRFYEINPMVTRVATDPRLFTFLPDAPMRIDLVPGDARKMLQVERAAGDPRYDILVVDAYNGDAVPYHLATSEAFTLYFDRLAPDGLLAVHVSNWHIDLLPLCKAMAQKMGACAYGVISVREDSVTAGSIWVFMTRRPFVYRYPGKERVREVDWAQVRDITVPTDEKGSLLPLLRNPLIR